MFFSAHHRSNVRPISKARCSPAEHRPQGGPSRGSALALSPSKPTGPERCRITVSTRLLNTPSVAGVVRERLGGLHFGALRRPFAVPKRGNWQLPPPPPTLPSEPTVWSFHSRLEAIETLVRVAQAQVRGHESSPRPGSRATPSPPPSPFRPLTSLPPAPPNSILVVVNSMGDLLELSSELGLLGERSAVTGAELFAQPAQALHALISLFLTRHQFQHQHPKSQVSAQEESKEKSKKPKATEIQEAPSSCTKTEPNIIFIIHNYTQVSNNNNNLKKSTNSSYKR